MCQKQWIKIDIDGNMAPLAIYKIVRVDFIKKIIFFFYSRKSTLIFLFELLLL